MSHSAGEILTLQKILETLDNIYIYIYIYNVPCV